MFLFIAALAHAAINCPPDSKNTFASVVKIIRTLPTRSDNQRHCTGTLVQNGCYVLTAGHCVVNKKILAHKNDFKILGGSSSEIDMGMVSEVHLHPDFKEFERNDVALLELKKCVGGGMPLKLEPSYSAQKVDVGGFGVTKLGSFVSQNKRHMGKGTLAKITDAELCLGSAVVAEDGMTVLEGNDCRPVGQDSGGSMIQDGKIIGIFTSSREEWENSGKTKIRESCYTNLSDPKIRAFIEKVLAGRKAEVPDKTQPPTQPAN